MSKQFFSARERWPYLVVLLGLFLRVAWWLYADPVPVSDYEGYRRLAEGLLDRGQLGGGAPSAYRLPGYPAFLASVMLISRSLAWLSFVNVVLSSALVYVVYRLAARITRDRAIPLVAALLCAVNPTFVYFAPILASEHLSSLLLFSSLLLVVSTSIAQLTARSLLRPFAASVVFGLAVLVRGDTLFYLPILIALAFTVSASRRARLSAAAVSVLGTACVITPWMVRNHYQVGPGAGLSTTGGLNFYYAHNPRKYGHHSLEGTPLQGKDELARSRVGYRLGWRHLREASTSRLLTDTARGTRRLLLVPGDYAVHASAAVPKRARRLLGLKNTLVGKRIFIALTYIYFALFVLALGALPLVWKEPSRHFLLLYGLVIANWVGNAVVFWAKARYRFPSEVVFCLLAALTIVGISDRIRRPRRATSPPR